MIKGISKNKIKYIRSLELRKKRKEEKVFLAETPKLVQELLEHFHCTYLAATEEWISEHPNIPADEIAMVSQEELEKTSLQKTPQHVLGIFKQPEWSYDLNEICQSLNLVLDDIQDPGNLGTIIRIADWFGIEDVFCSLNTADIYSPKAIQATMGAIARVRVHYLNITEFIKQASQQMPVYGTFLDGANIYKKPLSNNGLIIMGNEGKGICEEIRQLVSHKLLIPNFPANRTTSESLNVAIATAIVCAEFRRQVS